MDAMTEVQDYLNSLSSCRQLAKTCIRRPIPTTEEHLTMTQETGYQVYQKLTGMEPGPKQDGLLQQLYTRYAEETDQITQIVAPATAAEHTWHKRQYTKIRGQEQLIVKWKPTLMQGWMVEIAQKVMRYTVKQEGTREASEEEILDPEISAIHECCNPKAPTQRPVLEDDTAIICDTCQRAYHIACLPPSQAQCAIDAAAKADCPWECEECKQHKWTRATLPHKLRHYMVEWAESAEDRDSILQNPDWAPVVATYLQQHQSPATQSVSQTAPLRKCKLAATQHHLPDMPQQGDYYPNHAQRYDITIGQASRDKLVIHTAPMNPHTDIYPTGQYEIFVRTVEMRLKGKDISKELACIYDPNGICRFTLTPERAAILYHQYHQTQQRKPKLMRRLKAGPFAKEVYSLMCRYKDGALLNPENQSKVKLRNHWATPAAIYDAIRENLGVTKERFASPLNYNPRMTQYWSAHQRDQIFGAKWDAYKYKWTGASVHNPEYEDQDMNKGVATAVLAAQSTQDPVLGIHILPAWTNSNKTSYMRWVEQFPSHCKHLLQIPKRKFRFEQPTAWSAGDRYAGTPKWDVNIIVTGNEAGFNKHLPHWDPAFMNNFLEKLKTAINSTLPRASQIKNMSCTKPQPVTPQPKPFSPAVMRQLGLPSSNKYARRKADVVTDTERIVPIIYQGLSLETAVQQLKEGLPPAPALRYDWRAFAYTDGSCRQKGASWAEGAPGLGTGVYIPAKEQQPEAQSHFSIVPLSSAGGQDNTINRAELVGILYALREGELRIASDSLTSIYQVRKQLTRTTT
jgi:hypothetical protein